MSVAIDPRFEELVADYIYEHHGTSLDAIAKTLGIPETAAKQDAANIVQRLIDDAPAQISVADLERRGVQLKTVRAPEQHIGNKPLEPMTFPAFDPLMLAQETWESSQLRAQLHRLLIVVTRGKDGQRQRTFKIDFGFFWSPSADQWTTIREEWEEVRRRIAAYRADDLPRASETHVIHVKPKGKGRSDLVSAPGGVQMRRSGFALNEPFLEEVIGAA